MGVIHVLPEQVANKIAAGEVIERPASIVKELIENSLDAGADSLDIEINHGGRSLIRVSDNGSGMLPEDAELAFKRHATSKITGAADLAAIASFGFRGEALSSMAAVARVKLISRRHERPAGIEVAVEGGQMTEARECPCGPGTSIEVRDLFFNTPARRKFLRAESTELGHIVDAVSRFALARPDVRILFKSSGRTVLDVTPSEGDLRTRAVEVLGEDEVRHMLPVKESVEGIKVHGLIGKPFSARANRSGQIFFINGRWVRSISFSHALQAGYHGLLMHGQFPAAVIFVELDLERVDVNVHPTKQEVKISNENEVKSLLKKAVAGTLRDASDISPELKPFAQGSASSGFPAMTPSVSGSEKKEPVALFAAELEKDIYVPEGSPPSASAPASLKTSSGNTSPETRHKLGITKVLGQVHGTFLLAETEDGFMVVDQHAAHERVMFEALTRNFESGNPARQTLLMDEVLELHPRRVEILKNSLPLLQKIGFEIDEFGENAFIVRSYPAILESENPIRFLKTYLEEKEDGKVDTSLEKHHEDIAALIACKRQSVKAHDMLGPVQMAALLERLAVCENPFSCPHGRPAFFRKTFSELERQFKRK